MFPLWSMHYNFHCSHRLLVLGTFVCEYMCDLCMNTCMILCARV